MEKKQSKTTAPIPTRANPFTDSAGRTRKASLADVSRLGLACDKVLSEGAAIMFGLTRDGGALVVTVLDGDQRHRCYCADQTELERAVEGIESAYEPL